MPINIPTLHRIEAIKKESSEMKTFSFHAEEIARESQPGQFVMVWDPGVDFLELGCDVRVATEDGSEGYKGLVTLLGRYINIYNMY